MNVICSQGKQEDLGIVRKALRSGFLSYSPEDLRYLRKCGEWVDIQLVIFILEKMRPDTKNSAWFDLSSPTDEKYELGADAIYALGHHQLNEVIQIEMPDKLRVRLILKIPNSKFRALNDDVLFGMFLHKDDEVRKAAALKSVAALNRRRLSSLLDEYIAGDSYRYYNVVHWLDFGISLSKHQVTESVDRITRATWYS